MAEKHHPCRIGLGMRILRVRWPMILRQLGRHPTFARPHRSCKLGPLSCRRVVRVQVVNP